MKNIIIIGVILAVIDAGVLAIMKVLNLIDSESFSNLLVDSLSIVGILLLVGLLIVAIMNFVKK